MQGLDLLKKLLPVLIPILLLELGLMIYCVIDLVKREKTNGPKWMWALIIVLVNIIGPVIYLIVGRKDDSNPD
jgi:heme/copper-type cytochrome/quinol oxidase subunit 2